MNTLTSKLYRTLAASAILTALAVNLAGIASAAEADPVPEVTVKYADLDPSGTQGAAALYGRITRAAEEVCSRMYISTEAYRQHKNVCLQKLIADAVIKVNEPALSAVFASQYGVSPPVVMAAAGTR